MWCLCVVDFLLCFGHGRTRVIWRTQRSGGSSTHINKAACTNAETPTSGTCFARACKLLRSGVAAVVVVVGAVVVAPAEDAAAARQPAVEAARAEDLSAVTGGALEPLVTVRGEADGPDVLGAKHVRAPGAARESLRGAPTSFQK